MELKILHRIDHRARMCPDCHELGLLKRSRSRNFFETVVKYFTPLHIYRCKKCGWRGYRIGYVFKLSSVKAVFYYIILVGLTYLIVSFLLKKFVG